MKDLRDAATEQDGRHLRAILNTAPECIKLLSEDCRLLDINPAGLAMIDAPSLAAIRHADLNALIVPEYRDAFADVLRRVFKGETASLTYEVIGFAGRRLWMDTHGAPLWRDEDARDVEAALFVTRDVTSAVQNETHRRALEEQLRQSQKMEAVGRLAGGIAHDFNNLLTVIQGQISLIQATTAVDADLGDSLRAMADASQRAAALTRQLLTFSRRQVTQARDLDLGALVVNLATLLHRVLGEDVHLETRIVGDRLFVHADPTMIEQVVLNLAVNARDAMPRGGRLVLELERDRQSIRLTVSDTGSGISDADLPYVFEPFFTTKEVGQGSGLGLATVFGIVEQHGGQIDVSSAPNQGTTFVLTLPAVSRATTDVLNVASTAPLRGGAETILVVEDEEPVRQLARVILQRFGYQVIEAGTGDQALLMWQQAGGQIDLLLTDLMMPGTLSGCALADRLRQDRPDLKVIYMSGHSNDVLAQRLGVTPRSFLAKPFELPDFVRIVRNALDEPAAP
ncbi:MAG TPA: ATP-binding protein [Vicinamibacterales bacterium]|nr:ATP-binding protein [Vicinamibacterales bacterium]